MSEWESQNIHRKKINTMIFKYNDFAAWYTIVLTARISGVKEMWTSIPWLNAIQQVWADNYKMMAADSEI